MMVVWDLAPEPQRFYKPSLRLWGALVASLWMLGLVLAGLVKSLPSRFLEAWHTEICQVMPARMLRTCGREKLWHWPDWNRGFSPHPTPGQSKQANSKEKTA